MNEQERLALEVFLKYLEMLTGAVVDLEARLVSLERTAPGSSTSSGYAAGLQTQLSALRQVIEKIRR